MNRFVLAAALAFAVALPEVANAATVSFRSPAAEAVPVQWDGDNYGPPRWQRRHHWRQARRECYRYGDCRRLYVMRRHAQQRRYERDYGLYDRDQYPRRRHHRQGFSLEINP